jgi:hypothetical protein
MEIIEIALRIVEKMPFGALCFLNGGYKVAMWHPKKSTLFKQCRSRGNSSDEMGLNS